jgi:hypothetical protein
LKQSFDLDASANLRQEVKLADDEVFQNSKLSGSGSNSLSATMGNAVGSATSSLSSKGDLNLITTGFASKSFVGLLQDTRASGAVDLSLAGESGSNFASQNAGQSEGALSTSQAVRVSETDVVAGQDTGFAGVNGYTSGKVKSFENRAEVANGVNGLGIARVESTTAATDNANAFSQIQAASLDSKVYSAGTATSTEAEAYSFTAARDKLESTVVSRANGHVSSEQNLNAVGDALIYASTTDDTSSSSHAEVGNSVSGGISASAGSPQIIDRVLTGDAREITLNAAPIPGNWQTLGGQIVGRPSMLYDDNYWHHIVQGGDGAVWDQYDGIWYNLGGKIYGDPYAIQDGIGRVHIFARGRDNALWDKVLIPSTMSSYWTSLGGNIITSPTVQTTPGYPSYATVATVGGDNHLWLNNVYTGGGTPSSGWFNRGNQMIDGSTPWIMTHGNNLYTFAWGYGANDNLWANEYNPNNAAGDWHNLGGLISGAVTAANEPGFSNYIAVATRGQDGNLWVNDLNVASWSPTWRNYGGQIQGTPFAVADGATSSDYIHIFARGSDNRLWDARASAGTTSWNWYSLGGFVSDNPTGAKIGNYVVADVRGGDGQLWESY